MRLPRSVLALTASALAGCSAGKADPPPSTPPPAGSEAQGWCAGVPRAAFNGFELVATSSDWFRVYKVGPGVLAITEPFQFQEAISYLITGATGALLFDTGLGVGPIATVVRELTPLPVTVINSHTHYDHVGGNADFDRILAVDTGYTTANSAGFAHDVVAGEVSKAALCRPLPAGVDSATFRTRAWRPSERIRDGHRIDLGGRTIEVLQVPGHTPDAVALLDRDAKLLWTGDSFYEAPIWLFVPETDLAAYRRSMARLAALAPGLTTVYGSHNLAVSSPARLAEVVSALEAIRSGTAKPVDKGGGQLEFGFGRFSVLTSSAALAGQAGPADRGGSGLPVSSRSEP